MSVSIAVKEARGDCTQSAFAQQLGISQPRLSEIESGRAEPSKRVALRLSQITGKPLETFIILEKT